MTSWLSRPIESLLAEHSYPFRDTLQQQAFFLETDILVVGSGYGAAMAALALMETQHGQADSDRQQVWVFERGGEYLPDDFPKAMADMPGYLGSDRVNANALWDVRAGDNVVTVSGRGVGGTSLVNANVAARPDPAVLERWPQGSASESWQQRLMPAISKIEKLLGVNRHPQPDSFGRYRAMSATAAALDATASAAPLAVNFSGPTPHSTDHGPCNLCGNCVIGCHSGAKGSLNMNAWPLVRQFGADIFAGVVVRSLQRAEEGGWWVSCAPADKPAELIRVRCKTVILGAGTLGSTEILMRSQRQHDLGLSPALGKGFSTNGDALVFSIGQSTAVGPVASPPGQQPPATQPGPTIMGMAKVDLQGDAVGDSFTLEDAVIPYPLKQVWQELLVSQQLLRSFADGANTAWHQANPDHDVLAVSDALAEHSQALLVMGRDDSSGRLVFAQDRLTPSWERSGEADYFDRLDQRLRSHETKNFDGGIFSPNMLSQPLPPGFDGIVEGAGDIGGQLLSVHPLGGCCMANSSADGVVNTRGQVFTDARQDGVFHDLYVLDGAIVPGAIGTNPFLTIAALSYRLAAEILSDTPDAVIAQPLPELTAPFRRIPAGGLHAIPQEAEQKVSAEFSERLVLHLDHGKRSFFPWSRSGSGPRITSFFRRYLADIELPVDSKALVLDARFRFDGDSTLEAWLQKPQTPLQAQAELSADTVGSVLTTADRHLTPLLALQGNVTLGDTEAAGGLVRSWRTASAIVRYLHYRTMDALVKIPHALAGLILPGRARQVRSSRVVSGRSSSWWSQARVFWRIAGLQAQRRYLVYDFSSPVGLRISGRKTLGYGVGLQDLLRALMVLPVELRTDANKKLRAELELDAVRVTHGSTPLQIMASPDSAATLLAAGGLGMYFLRMIMQTHFWSFAAPSYGHFASKDALNSDDWQGRFFAPPDTLLYGDHRQNQSQPKEVYEFSVQHDGGSQNLSRLVRYQPATGNREGRKSLLLVHGLAHSSRVFWTDTIDCNFVQYFLAQNYDVWILDHRASANYIREVTPAHTWDSIAMHDVPWAIRKAFEVVNAGVDPDRQQGIHVFSHCIGAGAVAMAVLAGKLNRLADEAGNERSMLASLVPHAVTPWLVTSGENRARANMWAMVKDLEPIRIIEPMPYREPALMETLYDRLAALAMTADERRQWSAWKGFRDWRGPGFAQSIYTRYTIFWGRQWHNANISDATRYEFAGMIGPVPIGVMQQVYFSLTRGLLSNHDGANEYVREENFARHWTFPTYFLHGNRNTVFDMESSRQSADRLTRLRRRQRTGQYYTGTLEPVEYAAENIWIDVLDDYGHMDMIFSKTANEDVYPRLHEFFSAADDDSLLSVYQRRYRDPAQQAAFTSRCRSNSHVRPPSQPLTGPIVSRPQCQDDGNGGKHLTVRLWVEAQDFTAMPATGLTMSSADAADDSLTQLAPVVSGQMPASASASADTTGNWQQEFWLFDFVFDPEPARAHRLSLNYERQVNSETSALLVSGVTDEGVALVWHDLPWFERVASRTQSDPLPPLTVLAGSCLYPGLPFERNRAMQIFEGMESHICDNDAVSLRGADCMILLGDQIYADATADLFDPKAHYEKFRNPYRIAFGSPAARRLMSQLPSYFVVDDHEYRDNWQGEDDSPGPDYDYARRMAWLFQMHHQPALDESRMRLWYDFVSAGYPFFVFDTRLHRHNGSAGGTRLLGAEQIEGFMRWLQRQVDSPVIFLATGSPLAPIPRSVCTHPATAIYQDSLLAYPVFLSRLVELLHEYAPGKRIVWLCGDPHFSCFAQLTLSLATGVGEKSVQLTQVCASGLYAPMSFINANVNDYDWHSGFAVPLPVPADERSQSPAMQLRVCGRQILLSDSKQHFVRLDLEPAPNNRLRLQAFGADGEAAGPTWLVNADGREVRS